MSLSKVISRDDAESLQKWVNSSSQASADLSLGAAPLLTAQQVEEIQKEAQQEGYKVGYDEGIAAAKNDIAQQVKRLESVFNFLQQPLEQLDDEVEQELASLALAIAKQIIRRELKTEPEHVIGAIREALGALPVAARNIQVLLHPDDARVVRENISMEAAEENWKIVENPTVTRGGCRVETETSTVDATLERRLAAVVAQVLGGERSSDEDTGAGA